MAVPVQRRPRCDREQHLVEIALPPRPESAAAARRFIRDTLADDRRCDVAEVVIGELAANVILHANTAFVVRLLHRGERIRCEVQDGVAIDVMPSLHSSEATTGRGLELVAALTDRWGTQLHANGKVIWFELT